LSCATCHKPEKAFSDGEALPSGNDGKPLTRHTPTALNAAYSPVQFWDGRAQTLEEQAMGVIQNAKEFDTDIPALIAYVTSAYGSEFQAAYGSAPTPSLVTKAIASYERKEVVSGEAPFDRWAKGDAAALSEPALIGLGIFLGKGNCVACHSGPLFSDGKFHNIAVPGSGTKDPGRMGITANQADFGAFKTPTLRNVELTAPYFHDGSEKTLGDAIRFYENFDAGFPNLDKDMTRSNFSEEMLEFLKSLTSPQATP
jgi:cytochrome c peroxidase